MLNIFTSTKINGYLFMILMLLLAVAACADDMPAFCHSRTCDDVGLTPMNWHKAEQALQWPDLTKGQCYPLREPVEFSDASVQWSLEARKWRIRTRMGQASQLEGDLRFISSSQVMRSTSAWLWRSEDSGLDKLCLPDEAIWEQETWKVLTSKVFYEADTSEVTACDNAFVLYGKDHQTLSGYARQIRSTGQDSLHLRSVHATACPLSDRAWSIAADELEWSVSKKQAHVKNMRFYFYDVPVARLSELQFDVGGHDRFGWQMPRFYSYYQDTVLLEVPYQFATQQERLFLPWLGSSGSAGGAFVLAQNGKQMRLRGQLRFGGYLDYPYFRYGGIVQGEQGHLWGKDQLTYQFLHMRDGWFAQYFSPKYLSEVRPNQDLPNRLEYQRQDAALQSIVQLIYYQKFSGPKVQADASAVPYLHVLPRVVTRFEKNGWQMANLAENLVSENDKDNYPGVTRAISYWGYQWQPFERGSLQVGAWAKRQVVQNYPSWNDTDFQHGLFVPNVALDVTYPMAPHWWMHIAYAYTPYIDQSRDPVFQRHWRWLGGLVDYDKLESVDRIYDRNRMWLGFERQGLPYWAGAKLQMTHILDLKTPRVSLSQTGDEDPLIRYANEVSQVHFEDKMQNFSADAVWVWSTRTFYRYHLDWQGKRLALRWSKGPDLVSVEGQDVSVPMYHEAGTQYTFYEDRDVRLFVGCDYKSGLDQVLKYSLGWSIDRCCWQGKASLHLIRWMTDDAAPSNVYQGWQPSAKISFSLKGLSSVK